MKDFLNQHSEVLVLVFIFVFGSIMLAAFPMREELARWIEGGAIITVLARGMGGDKTSTKPVPPIPNEKSEEK